MPRVPASPHTILYLGGLQHGEGPWNKNDRPAVYQVPLLWSQDAGARKDLHDRADHP